LLKRADFPGWRLDDTPPLTLVFKDSLPFLFVLCTYLLFALLLSGLPGLYMELWDKDRIDTRKTAFWQRQCDFESSSLGVFSSSLYAGTMGLFMAIAGVCGRSAQAGG
jgi:hypothetical protein